MTENYSLGVQIADLQPDFHSQVCVKPQIIERTPGKKAQIKVTDDGTYLEVSEEGKESILESAKISLNDCLACSGCVTSAESILVTAQSVKEFLQNVEQGGKKIIISISPQSRASLAVNFGLDILQTHKRLITFFRQLGADHVFDTTFSRDFSLLETAAEFVARYKKEIDSPLPMLTSACPGWVCYAEKTHGEVLPYISTTKSPQQIMGTIVKYYFAEKINTSAEKIYHVCVMPCYDKKLEASRNDFYNDILQTRDVDLVLTSGEIVDLLKEKSVDFRSLSESPVETLFTNITSDEKFFGMSGGSGGYLEFTFKYAAKELFGVHIDKVDFQPSKNNDFRVATLEVNGKTVLTFALAYGFKNIQNIIRGIKTKSKKSYDFVEVMACPSGCLNGGGQIIDKQNKKNLKVLLQEVEDAYNQQIFSGPDTNVVVKQIYNSWLSGIFAPDAHSKLHTQYHKLEKTTTAVALKW